MVALHQLLGKDLAALDARGGFGRAEDGQAVLLKLVHDAFGERPLRADHGEVNAVLLGKGDEGGDVGGADGDVVGDGGGAGVAGGDEDFTGLGALRQLPDDGVLPGARADNEKFQS